MIGGQIRRLFLGITGGFLAQRTAGVRRGGRRAWRRAREARLRGGEVPESEHELGFDEFGPMHQGVAVAAGGLKVAQEAVEQRMGDEEHQPEGGNGNGMMMEVVVGMPIGGQLVEAFVFDPPTFVAEEDDRPGGDLVLG